MNFFFLLRTRENFKKKNVDNLTLFLHRTWADMHAQTVDPYRVEAGQKVFPLAFSDQTNKTWTSVALEMGKSDFFQKICEY